MSNMPGTKWDGFWPSAIRVFCGSTLVVPQGDASFPTLVSLLSDGNYMRFDVSTGCLSYRDCCDSLRTNYAKHKYFKQKNICD